MAVVGPDLASGRAVFSVFVAHCGPTHGRALQQKKTAELPQAASVRVGPAALQPLADDRQIMCNDIRPRRLGAGFAQKLQRLRMPALTN